MAEFAGALGSEARRRRRRHWRAVERASGVTVQVAAASTPSPPSPPAAAACAAEAVRMAVLAGCSSDAPVRRAAAIVAAASRAILAGADPSTSPPRSSSPSSSRSGGDSCDGAIEKNTETVARKFPIVATALAAQEAISQHAGRHFHRLSDAIRAVGPSLQPEVRRRLWRLNRTAGELKHTTDVFDYDLLRRLQAALDTADGAGCEGPREATPQGAAQCSGARGSDEPGPEPAAAAARRDPGALVFDIYSDDGGARGSEHATPPVVEGPGTADASTQSAVSGRHVLWVPCAPSSTPLRALQMAVKFEAARVLQGWWRRHSRTLAARPAPGAEEDVTMVGGDLGGAAAPSHGHPAGSDIARDETERGSADAAIVTAGSRNRDGHESWPAVVARPPASLVEPQLASRAAAAKAPVKHGGPGSYQKDEQVEYYSGTYGQWLPATVTDAHEDGRLKLSVKPNVWLTMEAQRAKVRPRCSGGGGGPSSSRGEALFAQLVELDPHAVIDDYYDSANVLWFMTDLQNEIDYHTR